MEVYISELIEKLLRNSAIILGLLAVILTCAIIGLTKIDRIIELLSRLSEGKKEGE